VASPSRRLAGHSNWRCPFALVSRASTTSNIRVSRSVRVARPERFTYHGSGIAIVGVTTSRRFGLFDRRRSREHLGEAGSFERPSNTYQPSACQ